MKKYIDADKLIAEIERYIKHYEKLNRDEFKNGELYICQELLSFIKSLQQEQPEVDLEKETETWISTHIKVETGGIQQVNTDELAKTVKEWGKGIARHFFELGLNAKEESK